jgi:hypothetical protein
MLARESAGWGKAEFALHRLATAESERRAVLKKVSDGGGSGSVRGREKRVGFDHDQTTEGES